MPIRSLVTHQSAKFSEKRARSVLDFAVLPNSEVEDWRLLGIRLTTASYLWAFTTVFEWQTAYRAQSATPLFSIAQSES